MDDMIIAFIVIISGALVGVIAPYLLKQRESGGAFDMSYLYSMVLSLMIAAFAILPDTAVDLTFKGLFTLFLAGAALQVAVNKANTIRIKKADN